MKLKEIFKANNSNIFQVINDDFDDELEWEIEETKFKVIPDLEGTFYVPSILISEKNYEECYLEIITPERISENVVLSNDKKVSFNLIHDLNAEIIPIVGSECLGLYELYYSKQNPIFGINILKKAFENYPTLAITEDLGYILRDEGEYLEAINYFLISEKLGPSSEYIFLELSNLFKEVGNEEKATFYKQKFEY
ncbi:hypothetical protein SAMN05660477_00007 [Soonwooa buanensis]|uniref:Uncharacterized protein n=1 Tax=Soonwooa buanensis TaxID=619805 RepID=A0A1T5CEG3_9FLAO|nr:hypothetical protein [Soonwooa buanensis]SKB57868.1 hypothetical protein SAMN05660477_00007 [Soonwooa buanensis]